MSWIDRNEDEKRERDSALERFRRKQESIKRKKKIAIVGLYFVAAVLAVLAIVKNNP